MKNWLLSIVGLTCLGVLIDILISKNKENKFIKGLYSIIMVCVIVEPIITYISSNNLKIDFTNKIEIQETYLNKVSNIQSGYYENLIINILENKGYKVISTKVYMINNMNFHINQVTIKIEGNLDNIDKSNITNIVYSILGEEAQIFIYS